MTDTMTFHNIDLSSWDTLYIHRRENGKSSRVVETLGLPDVSGTSFSSVSTSGGCIALALAGISEPSRSILCLSPLHMSQEQAL
jgi:hypothetical protein